MNRALDIGIASYGKNATRLAITVTKIQEHTTSDFRLFIIHNPSEGDEATQEMICALAAQDSRITPVWTPSNFGYAGAVNELLCAAVTDYVAYVDNDATIETPGWDETFCALMDAHPEIGQVFPGSGHYGFHNGQYNECLWNAGYCWIVRSAALLKMADRDIERGLTEKADAGLMDTTLGHHEEVDLMIRLRLAGYQIACCPEVTVRHEETATKANEADHKPGGRIHDGVVRWMNKWNRYFCGGQLKYSMTKYDDRMLRYTDWPPCALYLERMTLHHFPKWNAAPRAVNVTGVGSMDAVEVLKPTDCYRGRAI